MYIRKLLSCFRYNILLYRILCIHFFKEIKIIIQFNKSKNYLS